jgi:hypothetical protein
MSQALMSLKAQGRLRHYYGWRGNMLTHLNKDGVATTPIPGVFILSEAAPSLLQFAITKPLLALVLQGRKRVTMGNHIFEFGAGESLLVTVDVPTVSQVITASAATPIIHWLWN